MNIYRVSPPLCDTPQNTRPQLALERHGELFALPYALEELADVLDTPQSLVTGGSLGFCADALAQGRVHSPVTPTKIVCVGLNYVRHAQEMGKPLPEEPLIFLKPPSTVVGPGQTILLPAQSAVVHHEGELAVVVGRRATDIQADAARHHILGFTCANDVTARDIQRKDMRYTRAKGFDTFCPLGPAIVTREAFWPESQALTCRVNGETRQQSGLEDMIFGLGEVLAFITAIMTLEPGDVVLTGTPAGVGLLADGDVVEVAIEGIGLLQNPVGLRPPGRT